MIVQVNNLTKFFNLYASHAERVKETFHPFRKKYHRKFQALKNCNLTIGKGETVGIIGRNGSGKSTLLQLICGILSPSLGSVEVKGRVSALLELGAGFNPEFTGRENIFLNGAILGLSKQDMEECLDDILQFADIGAFIDQPVKTFSSGMYVRLAFAVAINVKPDLLIVDEALSVGDTLFQAKCYAKFKEFQQNGVTIIFVTHSLDLITRYCSRAVLLDKGEIVSEGNPKDVVDAYNRLLVRSSIREDCKSMDNPALDDESTNSESRYGIGKVSIDSIDIRDAEENSVRHLSQGENYDFIFTAKFQQTVNNPIFAFTVKDVQGFDITGTNTLYQEIDTGVANRGDRYAIRFRQKILLAEGGYLLSFGCAGFEEGDYTVYERRYDAIDFQVVAKQATVGFFNSGSKISISKQNS